jgi:hypothetical protein
VEALVVITPESGRPHLGLGLELGNDAEEWVQKMMTRSGAAAKG